MKNCLPFGTFFAAAALLCLCPEKSSAEPLRDMLESECLSPAAAAAFFGEAVLRVEEFFDGGETYAFSIDGIPVSLSFRDADVTVTSRGMTAVVSSGGAPFAPLVAGISVGTFDLFSQYLFWPSVAYEGPGKIIGRRAQRFLVVAPSDVWAPVAAVRVWLDSKFYYPIAWDALDGDGALVRRFRLRSLIRGKDGEWGPKRMDIFSVVDRRRSHIEVVGHGNGD
ncbi:MAG: hypothetical protein LBS68_00020 [Puniceicoccales bacterium]|jgi:hypothetical protein|nr:hypothetical protein [Puniceicoccales bacterium]